MTAKTYNGNGCGLEGMHPTLRGETVKDGAPGASGEVNGKGNSEMRGSLHYATHDGTVSRFGRDDAFWGTRTEWRVALIEMERGGSG